MPVRRKNRGAQRRMSKKIYVGGLGWETGNEGLLHAFERFGEVAAAKVIAWDAARALGLGYVTCSDEKDASRALAEMDGGELEGHRIRTRKTERYARCNKRRCW